MLSLIVAMDKNRVIGYKNDMPWHLPNDLRHFKEKTSGHTIIMGRKTFESIGRVLPNRKHIVLTRSKTDFPDEVQVIHDTESIQQFAKENQNEELFVIGGGHLFQQIFPYADKLYVTLIEEEFEGDVYFPEIEEEVWRLVAKERGLKDERNPFDYFFLEYERK